MPIFGKKQDIWELLDKFDKSTAAEIEVTDGDMRIHIKKIDAAGIQSAITAAAAVPAIEAQVSEVSKLSGEKPGKIVKAPLIGIYYAAPSPESEPFAEVGKKVSKGSVLCIIEAMKVMNEVESKFDGEIAEIFVKNAETVEYGQPLFRII
jgi:acetyl-CoA carboxylase biotin carboxyl carrier protein